MKNIHTLHVILAIGMLTSVSLAVEPIVTDRPDQTESSATVDPGYFQVELGYTHTEDDEAGNVKIDNFPGTLLRYGLVDNLELRLVWDGYNWQETKTGGNKTKVDGSGDMAAGLKWRFLTEEGWRPETALLTHFSIPVGKTDFSTSRVDPEVRFAFSHTLNETFSFGYNLGTAWVTSETATGELTQRNQILYTAALGIGLTEELGAFVEFFGDAPTYSGGGGPANSFDGGFTYLLADNIQLDFAGGVGVSKAADDWFVGVGLSIRTPN